MIPYPYAATHIPALTPEVVRAIINNPKSTFDDLDALLFAILNSDAPGMGRASEYVDIVLQAQTDWIENHA